MEEILKNLENNINRLLKDVNRTYNWDNETRCSESVKNLCIAYACLTRRKLDGYKSSENNLKID